MARRWTIEEDNLLKADALMYGTKGVADRLCETLGRSKYAIQVRLSKLRKEGNEFKLKGALILHSDKHTEPETPIAGKKRFWGKLFSMLCLSNGK